jgi:GxxExxY protein
MEVFNKYGKGFKEMIYQNALAEEFTHLGIKFEKEKRVEIYSVDSGKSLGYYTPDFIVEDKVVV